MSPAVLRLLEIAQAALLLGGLAALWRYGLSPAARRTPAALAAWDVSLTDFFLFIWIVLCSGLIAPFIAGLWIKRQGYNADLRLILSTVAFQGGLLLGVAIFRLGFGRRNPAAAPLPRTANPLVAGAVTLLVALPVVMLVSLVWQTILKLCHIEAPQQEAIDILRNAHSALPVALLLLSAIVIAPISEELIFRAGVFRYVRTRLPRWAALLLPAAIFGAMHANLASFAPLVALGIVFSLAYERTGRISTSMVAHALFNLTTTLLVLAGVDT